jgi:hypothetical protein
MYCPNCGSNNQAEMKFCTHCGTNLGVVSEALSARAGSGVQLDDRMVKVIKDYYKGRRDTITGLVLIPAAVKLIAMLALLGVRPISAFFIVSWMIFWGIAALAGGLGKWIGASGEMKALGHEMPRSKLLVRAEKLLRRGSSTGDNYSTGPVSAPISTPVSVPLSVTEQTTRTLEERTRPPKQTQ